MRQLLAVMRILKIELPATLTSTDPDVSLASDSLREQLRRELDALKDDLGEDVRRRASTYFPSHFTIFVRFFFNVDERSRRAKLGSFRKSTNSIIAYASRWRLSG